MAEPVVAGAVLLPDCWRGGMHGVRGAVVAADWGQPAVWHEVAVLPRDRFRSSRARTGRRLLPTAKRRALSLARSTLLIAPRRAAPGDCVPLPAGARGEWIRRPSGTWLPP